VWDVTVVDDDPPTIEREGTPTEATTGDALIFSVEALDNIGISSVLVTYRYGGEPPDTLALTRGDGDVWEATIDVNHTSLDLRYQVTARDTSGNENTTIMQSITIADNDPPEVVEDLSDTTATTGDPYMARIRVHDNIGVDMVTSGKYPWTAIEVDEDGNGLYEFHTTIFEDIVGQFYLPVRLVDVSGNEYTYMVNTPDIVDNDPPLFSRYPTNMTAVKGMGFYFSVRVMDNVVSSELLVYVEYRIGDGPLENGTMFRIGSVNDVSCSHTAEIPRDTKGVVIYRYVAVDAAGNWNSTDEMKAPIINPAPSVADLPMWYVTESDDGEFDLTGFVSDNNDETFTVECSDKNITIDGLVLKVRHDAWVPDYIVVLSVSDGEDVTPANLTGHVVNVNDPPVIVERLPATGSKYKEGKKVALSATTEDEDGDELNVTWWDGDVELGTSSHLEVKLKPGEHTITVVVDDGTDQVDDTFTVIVKKKEESPSASAVFVLMALLVVAAFSVSRLRKGTR
jgi:hypothetical protein